MTQCSASHFTDHFISSLLEDLQFTEMDEGIGDERFDRELSPQAHKTIAIMCKAFFIANEADILSDELEYCSYWGDDREGKAGHNFYMQVIGHGVGFWDGRYPEKLGAKLSEACEAHAYSISPYVGDDGLVYV